MAKPNELLVGMSIASYGILAILFGILVWMSLVTKTLFEFLGTLLFLLKIIGGTSLILLAAFFLAGGIAALVIGLGAIWERFK